MQQRFNSSWSSVTSLWNRIRGAGVGKESNLLKTATSKPSISPWSQPAPKKALEPLTQFWIRTGMFRVSAQKLNLLGRQISTLPLQQAIIQMQFSPKRAAREILSLLLQAQGRIRAAPEKPDPSAFTVQQAVVGKGTYLKRIDIKGRGRHGVIWRPHSFLRLQVGIPDADALLKNRFKVRISKENKPVMLRLDY
jgi:ribosomal protein L22